MPTDLPDVDAADLDATFARVLRFDVANSDASVHTARGYRSQLAAWVGWCADQGIDARTANVDDVKRYREDLVAQGRQASTIAHKLNVLRRHRRRAPRDRRAPEDFGYLSEVELALLFRAVPRDDELKHLRDRALLGLLGLQALRTVEITRASVDDLQRHGDNWALLLHGKYHDGLAFSGPTSPRPCAPICPLEEPSRPTNSARHCSSPTATSRAATA